MRHGETRDHPHVDADEFNQKPEDADCDQIAAEYCSINLPLSTPSDEHDRNWDEHNRFIELRRMHGNSGWRQALRERDGPWQVAWSTVVVAYEKASNAANRMPNRQPGSGRSKHGDDRQAATTHQPQSRGDAAREASEPAHATARQDQTTKRFFSQMFEYPQGLRPDQATDDASHAGVHRVARQTGAFQLPAEQPESDDRTDGDEHAEAGDLELTDAKENRVNAAPPVWSGRVLPTVDSRCPESALISSQPLVESVVHSVNRLFDGDVDLV